MSGPTLEPRDAELPSDGDRTNISQWTRAPYVRSCSTAAKDLSRLRRQVAASANEQVPVIERPPRVLLLRVVAWEEENTADHNITPVVSDIAEPPPKRPPQVTRWHFRCGKSWTTSLSTGLLAEFTRPDHFVLIVAATGANRPARPSNSQESGRTQDSSFSPGD